VYEILEHVDRHLLDLEIWPNLLFSLDLTPCVCSGSIPANSRHKTSCISRRLADCKSEQKAVIIRLRELSQSPEIFRFSGKQRKIDTYPNPNSNLETEDFELITLVLNAKSEIFPMCMKYWNM
jgi:hypothetical protein